MQILSLFLETVKSPKIIYEKQRYHEEVEEGFGVFPEHARTSFSALNLGPAATMSLPLSGTVHSPRESICLIEFFLI